MRSVVITGASSGIGMAAASLLIAKGFHVYGSVRRSEDGERLGQQLGAAFTPLLFDVTDEQQVRAAAARVRADLNGDSLAGLVNNAGIAVAGPVLELPLADYRRQFEVNLFGAIAATQAFAPLLGAELGRRGAKGRIIMISSVAGRNGNPFMSAYCASKHALEGLSESLRREMMMDGIKVVVVAPGAVRTPIWDKADGTDIRAYTASPYYPALKRIKGAMDHLAQNGLPAERIAAVVYRALTTPDPKVRYAVTPDPLRHLIAAILPKKFVDRIIANRLGLRPA